MSIPHEDSDKGDQMADWWGGIGEHVCLRLSVEEERSESREVSLQSSQGRPMIGSTREATQYGWLVVVPPSHSLIKGRRGGGELLQAIHIEYLPWLIQSSVKPRKVGVDGSLTSRT